MDDDSIIFTQNYYGAFGDPGNYYKDNKSTYISKPLPFRPIYVGDIIDNNDCTINFNKYRNKDSLDEPIKTGSKEGVVHSYNKDTKLLEVISKKQNPTLKKFNTKLRYVEPEFSKLMLAVHSSGPPTFKGKQCTLTRTNCEQKPECLKKLQSLVEKDKLANSHMLKDYAIKAAGKISRRQKKLKKVKNSIRHK
jgi:hypothetical protein